MQEPHLHLQRHLQSSLLNRLLRQKTILQWNLLTILESVWEAEVDRMVMFQDVVSVLVLLEVCSLLLAVDLDLVRSMKRVIRMRRNQ